MATPLRAPMAWAIVGAASTVEELQSAIDATTHANRAQLRAGGIPPLYQSGVVYERETRAGFPRGVERFQTARDAYNLGHSDCDGLAPWRASELQLEGIPARAKVIPSGSGYHVIVERGDGTTEDPSARLGMLDGYGLGDGTTDARPTARARRRRFMAQLVRRGDSLLRAAGAASGPAQARLLSQAASVARALRGMETQAAADGEPPLSQAEIDADPEVSGVFSRRRGRKRDAAAWKRHKRETAEALAAGRAPPEPPPELADPEPQARPQAAPGAAPGPADSDPSLGPPAPCECVGSIAIPERRGRWPFEGQPLSVRLRGKRYEKSTGSNAHMPGIVAHYREDSPRNSEHIYLLNSGEYVVHHVDAYNPNAGLVSAAKHYVYDVSPGAFEPVGDASSNWLDRFSRPLDPGGLLARSPRAPAAPLEISPAAALGAAALAYFAWKGLR